jgi:DNA-directed RNA polymerase specialized sigma24 family protein
MSERLGVSVSALKMRVMRAREALQAVLGSVLGRSRHGEV